MKIMAPAGDEERLLAAIKAGADEVYMGIAGFGARRFAKNFQVDEYVDAIDLAHRASVSVHLTFNTILSDSELDSVYPDMKRLCEAGLDEVIVQDFGVASWAREAFPELPLCASTQLSPATSEELNWFESLGFRRAVLARELTLDEIRAIRAETKIELEVFASGALCLGRSGKCYLSEFIGGRSGNRGMCAQPCRQCYRAERLDEKGAVVGEPQEGYFLSLKDQLQGPEQIAEMIKIGVDSIKIEGRMKSPSYVYETVRYYRDLVDELENVPKDTREQRLSIKRGSDEPVPPERDDQARRREIAALFNRGYDFGYAREPSPRIVNRYFASNFGVEIGEVRRDAVRLSQSLRNGDGVVFLDERARKLGGFNVGGIHWLDPTNPRRSRLVESAESGDLVRFDDPIPEGSVVLYRTYDHRLNKEIENALKRTRRREPIGASLVAKVGAPLQLTLFNDRARVLASSPNPLEPARKGELTADGLRESLDRFGETPFYLRSFDAKFDPGAFVPKSLLNQLRQEAVDALEKETLTSYRRVVSAPRPKERRASLSRPDVFPTPDDALARVVAVARSTEQREALANLGVQKIFAPRFPVRGSATSLDPENRLAGSLADALELERLGEPFALDWFFNVANSRAVEFLAERFPNAKLICLSPEISDRAIGALVANLSETVRANGVELALPIYGRLPALFARATLFDAPLAKLTNSSDVEIFVEKAPSPELGSVLRLERPLDLIEAIHAILALGVDRLRVEFTTETPREIERIVKRIASVGKGDRKSISSYGFGGAGAF